MRTTLDIPQELMEEAQKSLGFKSKTDVVVFSLSELLRRQKINGLKNLAGQIDLSIDIDTGRRRPKSKRSS